MTESYFWTVFELLSFDTLIFRNRKHHENVHQFFDDLFYKIFFYLVNAFMNTNEDDFILDLSASCTKDQAVMRMLGWGLLTMYPKQLHLMANGSLKEDSKLV